MAKTCVTEKTALRQRWIEDGLLELMLVKPYDAISVTELCEHLDLSRRSFYRYFTDLDDVLDSLLNHTFQELVLPSHAFDRKDFQASYAFWLEHRRLLDALRRSGMTDKLYEYALRHVDTGSIGDHLVFNDPDMDIHQEASLFILIGSLSMIIAWHAEGFRKTPEQMARLAERLLFSPILKKE